MILAPPDSWIQNCEAAELIGLPTYRNILAQKQKNDLALKNCNVDKELLRTWKRENVDAES